MEGVAHLQGPHPPPLGRQVGGHDGDGLCVARDDHRLGSVDRGQRHRCGVRREQRGDLRFGGLQRGHCAAFGQLGHEAPAGRHEGRGILKRQRPRYVHRHQLADGVSHEHVRAQSVRFPQAVERHFQREERRLGEVGAVQAFGVGRGGLGEEHLAKGDRGEAIEGVAGGVESLAEHLERGVQTASHLGPLASLACEQHRHPGLGILDRGHDAMRRRGAALREARQLVGDVVERGLGGHPEHQSGGVVRSMEGQRGADVAGA